MVSPFKVIQINALGITENERRPETAVIFGFYRRES